MRARGRFVRKKINGRLYNSFPFVTAVRKSVESLITFRKNLPTLLQLDEFALNFSVDVVKIQKKERIQNKSWNCLDTTLESLEITEM